MGPFVTGVVVADADKSALLAVERVLDCEAFATVARVGGKAW